MTEPSKKSIKSEDEEMPSGEISNGVVYIVYCKKKKKFDKFIKEKNDRLIIDINRSWSKEEGPDFTGSMTFKVMIWRKMTIALEKGKHIYYIPNMEDNRATPQKHLEMKKLLVAILNSGHSYLDTSP